MPKKNKNINNNVPEQKKFQHGDLVNYKSINIRSTVIGESVTEKDTYILELSDGTLETAHRDELEFVDFIREYDDGYKEGQSYAASIRAEILTDLRNFSDERSMDYAAGYLEGLNEEVFNLPSVLQDILDEEE